MLSCFAFSDDYKKITSSFLLKLFDRGLGLRESLSFAKMLQGLWVMGNLSRVSFGQLFPCFHPNDMKS